MRATGNLDALDRLPIMKDVDVWCGVGQKGIACVVVVERSVSGVDDVVHLRRRRVGRFKSQEGRRPGRDPSKHSPTTSSPSVHFSPSIMASRPANLLTIFQAHFHVKRGNEITYQYGHEIDLTGVEWSVLPSGSHALDTDLIWFRPPITETESNDSSEDAAPSFDSTIHNRIGLAVFRNRTLTPQEEAEQGQHLDQRGARMIAVGIIALCHDNSAPGCLAACLPHVETLYKLAETSSIDPTNRDVLSTYLDEYKFDYNRYDQTTQALQQSAAQRSPHLFARQPINLFDPVLDLPAIANSLGLILPDVLRTLLASESRLLIFTPTGANTCTAASLAWNLAEIIQAALNGREDDDDEDEQDEADDTAQQSPPQAPSHGRIGPRMRGILSLQDLTQLEDEAKVLSESRFQRQRHPPRQDGASQHQIPHSTWIAYTTDKLYLEKPHLYDYLLDLSPLCSPSSATAVQSPASALSPSSFSYGQNSTPGTLPVFSRSIKTQDSRQRTTAKLSRQAWHPRDFAAYRANELRSVRLASRPRSLIRRSSRSSVALRSAASDDGHANLTLQSPSSAPGSGTAVGPSKTAPVTLPRITSPAALLSTLLAFIRYYLSSMWFIPRQWRLNLRESYGYVPLSIRPDGGVQAGLLLLPDSDSEGSQGGSGDEEASFSDSGSDTEDENQHKRQRSRSSQGQPLLRVPSSAVSDEVESPRKYSTPSNSDSTSPQRFRNSFASDGRRRSSSRDQRASEAVSPGSSDLDIDPILAACGAGSSSSRRLSFSRSSGASGSSGPYTSQHLAGVRDSSRVLDSSESGEMTDSTVTLSAVQRSGNASAQDKNRLSRQASSGPSKLSRSSTSSDKERSRRRRRQQDPRDALLARAIFTIWSEWLCELVLNLERLASVDEQDGREALLAESPPLLTSRDFSAVGLNFSNKRDRELAADWTGREIGRPSWWASIGLGGGWL